MTAAIGGGASDDTLFEQIERNSRVPLERRAMLMPSTKHRAGTINKSARAWHS